MTNSRAVKLFVANFISFSASKPDNLTGEAGDLNMDVHIF